MKLATCMTSAFVLISQFRNERSLDSFFTEQNTGNLNKGISNIILVLPPLMPNSVYAIIGFNKSAFLLLKGD